MLIKSSAEAPQVTKGRHTFIRWLFIDSIRQLIKNAIKRTTLCMQIKREREILAKLSDTELRDIGVHRADADAESRRHFSDIPSDRSYLYTDLDIDEEGRRM